MVWRRSQPPSYLSFSIYRMGLKAGLELLFSIQAPGTAAGVGAEFWAQSPSRFFFPLESFPLSAYLLRVHERLPLGQGPCGKQS